MTRQNRRTQRSYSRTIVAASQYPAETPCIVCCGIINLGAAIYDGKIIRVIAPDAKTGNELWRHKAADIKVGYSMAVAPLVADGVIIVGISGAEFGTRSFIDGWDPAKGKHLWRTHTIPTSDDCSPETIGQPRGRPADPYRSSRSRTDPRSHVTIELSKRTAVSFAAVAAMAIVQMTSPSASELPNARDDQVQIEHGKVTYAQKCSHCHGPTWSTQAPFARRARR